MLWVSTNSFKPGSSFLFLTELSFVSASLNPFFHLTTSLVYVWSRINLPNRSPYASLMSLKERSKCVIDSFSFIPSINEERASLSKSTRLMRRVFRLHWGDAIPFDKACHPIVPILMLMICKLLRRPLMSFLQPTSTCFLRLRPTPSRILKVSKMFYDIFLRFGSAFLSYF